MEFAPRTDYVETQPRPPGDQQINQREGDGISEPCEFTAGARRLSR